MALSLVRVEYYVERVFLPVRPVAAPRQSRRDAWAPSAAVQRYHAFRDEVVSLWKKERREFPVEGGYFTFQIPMPKSWSKKKKAALSGTKHQSKPDLDNLIKALIDSVYRGADDACVWEYGSRKIWVPEEEAGIEIEIRLY